MAQGKQPIEGGVKAVNGIGVNSVLYTPSQTIHLAPKLVNAVNANDRGVPLAFNDQDELAAYMGRESKESEVVLGEIPDNARVYAFATCSYETSNSRTVVYAVEEVQ